MKYNRWTIYLITKILNLYNMMLGKWRYELNLKTNSLFIHAVF